MLNAHTVLLTGNISTMACAKVEKQFFQITVFLLLVLYLVLFLSCLNFIPLAPLLSCLTFIPTKEEEGHVPHFSRRRKEYKVQPQRKEPGASLRKLDPAFCNQRRIES
jgi:hypothetical protein